MQKGVLTQSEIDALMDLFETPPAQPRESGAGAADAASADIAVIKERCIALAETWSRALKEHIGHSAKVSLRSIVRTSPPVADDDHALYRVARQPDRFLLCPKSLINLVNEKRLGAFDEIPMLMHPLTAIDKALFEDTGSFFAREGALEQVGEASAAGTVLEARYDVEIAPYLRTKLRLFSHAESF